MITVKSNTLTSDIHFISEHLNYEIHVQSYSEKQSADTFTVALTGSLSENQALEDSVRGGHPETVSMQNDLALILLALLVPWDRLPEMFPHARQRPGDELTAHVWNGALR